MATKKVNLRERMEAHKAGRLVTTRQAIEPQTVPAVPNPLNQSMPCRTARPDTMPVLTVEAVCRQLDRETPEYQQGHAAGTRWAHELAEFTDLDAMVDVGGTLFIVTPYLRGFIDGATAAWADLAGCCFVRTA